MQEVLCHVGTRSDPPLRTARNLQQGLISGGACEGSPLPHSDPSGIAQKEPMSAGVLAGSAQYRSDIYFRKST